MNSVRPSGALKAQARDHLTGHYATAITFTGLCFYPPQFLPGLQIRQHLPG